MHQRLFASGNEEEDIITCAHVYIYPPARLISSRIDQRILEIEYYSFSRFLQWQCCAGINRELASFMHESKLYNKKVSASSFILRSEKPRGTRKRLGIEN